MVVTLLAACALRLVTFGQLPPGLYHDEAYNGLDAVDVLAGDVPLYFAANNGREPLFIYMIALSIGVLGRSPFALRLPAFFVGALTVAATGAFGRTLFSRRVGLIAAAVLAVTLWHVHLSRVGFRAVLLPLLSVLAAWQATHGVRTCRLGHWMAAGGLYGLSFYTYTASRFTPVALGAFGVYLLLVRRRFWSGSVGRGVAIAAGTALLTVLPLAVVTVLHPAMVLGRPGQVSILDPAIHGGDFWGELFRQFWRTLGMFFVRGDRIWRHNVPWRPIFDPILSVAFVIGLVVVLRRARSDAAGGFLLVWIGAMAMPTFLAEDAPHFLRSVGVLPFAAFLPALGIDWIVCRSRSVRLRALIAVLFLLFAATSTVRAYFWDYARTPTAAYWFEQGATSLAGRVNGFLGSGWDGRRMVRSGTGERCVVIDARLWNEWPQVRFLVGQEYSPAQDYLSLGRPAVGRPVGVFVWPYDDWRWAWELLPTPAEVIVEQGALSQGDLDPEPYTTYVAFLGAPPAAETPSAMARFTSGIELLAVETASMPDGRIRVRLVWRAPTGGPAPAEWQTEALLQADYTVFLHYLRDGERVAQADSPPAQGYYPTTQWRLGDVVNDDHFVVLDAVGEAREPIPGRDVVRFGFWQPESGAVLPLLDDAGNAVGDWVEVPVR